MSSILRRLQSLTTDHQLATQHRTLGFFGAWQALDDDPVLLCECEGDGGCPHRS
jgi:hypothetical protein